MQVRGPRTFQSHFEQKKDTNVSVEIFVKSVHIAASCSESGIILGVAPEVKISESLERSASQEPPTEFVVETRFERRIFHAAILNTVPLSRTLKKEGLSTFKFT